MNHFIWVAKAVTVCVLGFTLAACAGGPKYSEMQNTIPNLAANTGRIYIYRTAVVGFAIQPDVKIDGEVVGSAKPDGFFYVDRPPGDYTITTSTEVKRSLTLTLASGQTRYVRLDISMGFFAGHVSPELVDDATGEKDVASLHYAGKTNSQM